MVQFNRINKFEDGIDRLSSLPDPLLVSILSLLPLKSAAATSALSQRWRHLWAQHPHLIFDGSVFPHDFKDMVDNILKQLTSPVLQTFDVHISELELDDNGYSQCLNSWISLVCARKVASLKVKTHRSFPGKLPLNLPTCILATHSLVQLQLIGKLYFKLPESQEINISLPNLKKLDLCWIHLTQMEVQLVSSLIKGCPLLEDLYIKWEWEWEWEETLVVEISAHNLKSLVIEESLRKRTVYVIDAPLLQHFVIHHFVEGVRFANDPTTLSSANILIDDTFPSTQFFTLLRQFLLGFSSVESLRLLNPLDIFSASNYLPTNVWLNFHNLTHLIIDFNRVGGFFFKERAQYPIIPMCLLSKLKKIDILQRFQWDENDNHIVMLLEYIPSMPNVLDRLYICTVDVSSPARDDDRYTFMWEYKISKALLAIPNSFLTTCKVEFVGNYFHVSAQRPRNGLMVTFGD